MPRRFLISKLDCIIDLVLTKSLEAEMLTSLRLVKMTKTLGSACLREHQEDRGYVYLLTPIICRMTGYHEGFCLFENDYPATSPPFAGTPHREPQAKLALYFSYIKVTNISKLNIKAGISSTCLLQGQDVKNRLCTRHQCLLSKRTSP